MIQKVNDAVIEIDGLTRRFGRTVALNDVTLHVPRGAVLGLVGENGAGKTTLIKHLLGLYKAQAGTVKVFGLDPVREPVAVLSRLGYLSEDRDLPDWLTVGELVRYLAAFYPTWDDALATTLVERFALDANAKVRTLSQGQKARAGLVAALSYRPELLVLDEPSTGLDPVVRKEILGAIIRTIAEEGRTVLFSSHLLDEIERVCDHVAMIDRGRVVLFGPLDSVKESHRRVTLRLREPAAAAPPIRGALRCDGEGRDWSAVCRGPVELVAADAKDLGARIVEERVPSLDEIFVAHVGAGHSAAEAWR